MATEACVTKQPKGLSVFEKYLTVWVILCILGGIVLGKVAPGFAKALDGLAIYVGDAPVVSIPIAVCLFFMMYPIMVKIDFAEVLKAGKSIKPVGLTLFVNWAIKPFTMYAIALFFLGTVFYGLIGPEAVDHVKMPFGMDLALGESYGAGNVVLVDGVKLLEVPLWRSYLAGCILLGIAPCTAMVLVWGYLAKGNDGHTLVMVAINSLTMLLLYGLLGGFLLGVGRLPVPWQALLLSIAIYVALPLGAGYLSRKWLIAAKGEVWFREKFLHVLTPITIIALLVTLVLLFSFKGKDILSKPLTILWIAIPLFIQTNLIFWIGYGLSRPLKLTYEDAAPSAMIGASNHFEVAIATATMLFGLGSGAALATVVGVLIEVPVMLMLVKICLRTQHWFSRGPGRPRRAPRTGPRPGAPPVVGQRHDLMRLHGRSGHESHVPACLSSA
ncbi:MAG TPA: ACR3 family arsenite efflux transporter [Phycisphaerae bacterium]|nr:ACR3 family arsenite efflux transporter [Phycisphaerae bacterium]